MANGKLLFRSIHQNDLPALKEIAGKVGFGFTSFPKDPKTMHAKIERSLSSFKQEIAKESAFYLFVLEEQSTHSVHSIIGTSAIEASISYRTRSPFYNYEVANITQRSIPMNVEKHHQVLFLENNYQDDSVLCALFLDRTQRGKGQGALLSRARSLFIAEFPELFSNRLIAEMRGVYDEKGDAPFWQGLGQHFFDCDHHTILNIVSTEGTQIIADLMPTYPIYTFLLAEKTREVIATTHKSTRPAQHFLEQEGFMYRNYIDVLDGGPIMECEKVNLRTIKESKRLRIAGLKKKIERNESQDSPDSLTMDTMMICNTHMDFKAILGTVSVDDNQEVWMEEEDAKLLEVGKGDIIRFIKK